MMSIKIDPSNRQRTERMVRDYSASQMQRYNSFRNSYIQQETPQTPTFEEPQSDVSFDEEFREYAKDIKEVRSLVNLWKEEFVRRKTQPELPPLEKAVMADDRRTGGYSQSVLNLDSVQQKLHKHLHTTYTTQSFDDMSNELYKHLEPINFNAIKAVLNMSNQTDEDQGRTRWFREGIGSMRQLHEQRQNKAVMKGMQQTIEVEEEEENAHELEVLDIMDSLKEQFQSLSTKHQAQRDGKSKYRTGRLQTDSTANNKKILDYMSPTRSRLNTIEEEKEDVSQEQSITLDQLALIDSNITSEVHMSDLQEALFSLQNSEIKHKQLANVHLEEVKEELSEDENSYMSEIASLLSDKLAIAEEPQIQSEDVAPRSRYFLFGDSMILTGSPRKAQPGDFKHQRAFFSKKDDLVAHLNEVRRIRNNKKIQLKDLKIDVTEDNKRQIELDLSIQKDSAFKYIDQIIQTELVFNKSAPSSSQIRAKYANKQQKTAYEHKLCNQDSLSVGEEIKQEEKQQIKHQIIQESKKHNRFVTPATQYDLKHLDSQVNIGGFEKHRDFDSARNQMSLFDIHSKFDQIYGLTIIAIEVLVVTRPGQTPNFEVDPIAAVYFVLHNECADMEQSKDYAKINGAIFNRTECPDIENAESGSYHGLTYVRYAKNEVSLLNHVVELFRCFDPDIIVGYETETQSIGYICKRAETLTIMMSSMLSRVPVSLRPINESFYNQKISKQFSDMTSIDDVQEPQQTKKKQMGYFQQKWGQAVKLSGRVVINLWRLISHEINLTNYDIDNVCFHILKKREPRFDYETLTRWWQRKQHSLVSNTLLKKLHNVYSLIDTLNLIHRDINMANVYGIDYESIMTRGSQFRVEAILSKISKSQGYVLLSATPKQVWEQQQLEVIPLVIEPTKMFYTDPVIIVDFQSLYPSLIISYNLCYSTCLGKITKIDDAQIQQRKLGVYYISPNIKTFFGFESDKELTQEQELYILDNIIIAPNLNCFVKPHIREGLLPRMLREILNTRIMVKKSMKLYQPGSATYRMLDSRQLALKLIANVTYGYTAAGFSGRMPCCELADSVVSLGRLTIENAIKYINIQEDKQGTRVVYGDTDSLFILCQGQTLEQAFQIGDKIAKYITSINPFPMELKFEKVYYPCVTLAKKRYCGYKMEKITDQRILDAKGIETIRRDTVDAVQKIMDKILRLLFTNKDLSEVKQYLERQWSKIIQGDVDFKDFIFAKEVKYGTYKSLPPGAIVVERRLQNDPGAVPRYGERIPYVIVMGQGGAIDQSKIKDLVLSPEEFLARDGLMLNAIYYIKKQINPALNRIFLEIFDIDVNNWFDKMPKKIKDNGVHSKRVNYFTNKINSSKSMISQSKVSSTSSIAGQNSMMIDQFYQRKSCIICGSDDKVSTSKLVCKSCINDLPTTYFVLSSRLKNSQNQIEQLNNICLSCSNMLLKGRTAQMIDIEDISAMNVVPCVSYQCKVFHDKLAAYKDHSFIHDVNRKLHF